MPISICIEIVPTPLHPQKGETKLPPIPRLPSLQEEELDELDRQTDSQSVRTRAHTQTHARGKGVRTRLVSGCGAEGCPCPFP